MKYGLGLLALAWLSLAGCSATPTPTRCPEPAGLTTPETRADTSPQSRVFLVRHAEKADDGTKDPPLLPRGVARATCLAGMLGNVELTHVFATDLQRTELTVRPTAASHELEVVTFPASDIDALANALRGLPDGSVALVAGHSNTIPKLTEMLGAPLQGLNAKGHIPEQEHDRLIEVVLGDDPGVPPLVQLRYCEPSHRG